MAEKKEDEDVRPSIVPLSYIAPMKKQQIKVVKNRHDVVLAFEKAREGENERGTKLSELHRFVNGIQDISG